MDDLLEYLSNISEDIDFKKLIFPTIIVLLFIGGFVYLLTLIKHNEKSINNTNHIAIENEFKEDNEDIYVDIKGAVKEPGVYKLKSNSRVIDAIDIAGGLGDDANTRFINLSKTLNDGDVIVIYTNKEINDAKKTNVIYVETPCVCEEVKNDACYKEESNSKKININSANLDELKTLEGIGDAKAKSIIEYRTKNGSFKSIEDLLKVSGISETIFNKIKENITT